MRGSPAVGSLLVRVGSAVGVVSVASVRTVVSGSGAVARSAHASLTIVTKNGSSIQCAQPSSLPFVDVARLLRAAPVLDIAERSGAFVVRVKSEASVERFPVPGCCA